MYQKNFISTSPLFDQIRAKGPQYHPPHAWRRTRRPMNNQSIARRTLQVARLGPVRTWNVTRGTCDRFFQTVTHGPYSAP